MKFVKDIAKMLLSFIWIPLLMWIFKDQLLWLIQQNQSLYQFYSWCAGEIGQKSAMGCFILEFFGNLIVITFLMRHIIFLYFCQFSSVPPYVLITVSALAMFTAMVMNYIFGLVFGIIFKYLGKDSFLKIQKMLDKYGIWLIIAGYFFPVGFPIGFLSVIAGSSRFNFIKFIIVTMIGCFIYFLILFLLSDWLKGFVNAQQLFD